MLDGKRVELLLIVSSASFTAYTTPVVFIEAALDTIKEKYKGFSELTEPCQMATVARNSNTLCRSIHAKQINLIAQNYAAYLHLVLYKWCSFDIKP